MDLKQRFAILEEKKRIIQHICENDIYPKSGIYCFFRFNEKEEYCFYIGQARDVLTRTAQHLMGRTQHIDKSLYKHGFYSIENPCGWRLHIIKYCDVSQLDLGERYYIDYYLSQGFKSYNVCGGGQINKAKDIGKRQQTKLKSYKNGKGLGYEKARNEVKVFFEKYLDFTIKGNTNKIKERKFNEFKEWLNES